MSNTSSSPSPSVGKLVNAIAFAADKHKSQRRKDAEASPYINHPIGLVNVLVNEGGIINNDVLCAAVLHDTIEDTETTAQELSSHFGEKIASIVMEVTDDKNLPKAERKLQQIAHAVHSSHEAKLVKLADKICNLRDMLASPPAGWDLVRRKAYFDWADQVSNGLKGTNSKLENILKSLIARSSELKQ
ncbi:HD domain-containing protein [Polynucleobacter antarcticus]|uniref:Phosphohydrolase n=1 Tax=Polynucleobacter antarcticus TaxID=1743162 RepID=A0A6M9PS60_9BURK|nr:HD domain-containing protein [Polynucleobacter antarcticus]QKM62702.1 phosphohydrolase [Polynucleobacter antarcticus]